MNHLSFKLSNIIVLMMLLCSSLVQASNIFTEEQSIAEKSIENKSIYEILTEIESKSKEATNKVIQNYLDKVSNNRSDIYSDYRSNIDKTSLGLENLFPELKDNFQISQYYSPRLKAVIDKVMQVIFNLKNITGSSGFCAVVPMTSMQFNKELGISSQSLGEEIYRNCLQQNPKITPRGSKLFGKNYIFVKVSDEKFKLTGWSTNINTTFLFVKPSTTWGDLTLAIIHEMAMSYDTKLFLAYTSMFTKAFKTGKISCSIFSFGSCSIDIPNEEISETLLKMSALPEIAYTFAAMRAIEVERIAISELTGTEIAPPDLREEFNKVYSILPQFIKSSEGKAFVAFHDLLIKNARNKFIKVHDDKLSKEAKEKAEAKKLEEVKEFVLNPENKFVDYNGDEVDFVQFMATPDFAISTYETFFSTGPGCGFCGGAIVPEIKDQWDSEVKKFLNGNGGRK